VSPKQLQPWAQVNHILVFKITHQVDINFPVGMLNGSLIYYFDNNTKKKVHKLQSILKKQIFSKSKKIKIKAHNGERSKQKQD
jgi:hypothetical protein